MNTKIVLRYQVSQKLALSNINKLNAPNDDPKRIDYTHFVEKDKLKKNNIVETEFSNQLILNVKIKTNKIVTFLLFLLTFDYIKYVFPHVMS